MNSMNAPQEMMRTVTVNDRGQIVIPEEMRGALGIEGGSVLVLVKRGSELLLRREEDVLAELEGVWASLGRRALERAWDEEDEVWDEHFEEGTS